MNGATYDMNALYSIRKKCEKVMEDKAPAGRTRNAWQQADVA